MLTHFTDSTNGKQAPTFEILSTTGKTWSTATHQLDIATREVIFDFTNTVSQTDQVKLKYTFTDAQNQQR